MVNVVVSGGFGIISSDTPAASLNALAARKVYGNHRIVGFCMSGEFPVIMYHV